MNPSTNYGFPGSPHVMYTQNDYYVTNSNNIMQQQSMNNSTRMEQQSGSHKLSTPNTGSPMIGPYNTGNASNGPQYNRQQTGNRSEYRQNQYHQVYLPINSSIPPSVTVYSQPTSQSQQINNGHPGNNNNNNNNQSNYVQPPVQHSNYSNYVDNSSRYQNVNRTATKDFQALHASSDLRNMNTQYTTSNVSAHENPNSAPNQNLYPHHALHTRALNRGTESQNNHQVTITEYSPSPYNSPVKAVRRMSDHRVPNSPMDSPMYANAYRPQPQMHPSQPQQQQMIHKSPNMPSAHGSPNPAYIQNPMNSALYTVQEQPLLLTPPVIHSEYYVNGPNNQLTTKVGTIPNHEVKSNNNKIVNPHQASTLKTPVDPYPPFIMLKKPDITIYEIYIEWYYGLNGKEAVYSLNSKGSRWRTRTSADRMFYRKRKTVVDYIILVIRHLKMSYNIHDDNHTIPDNMIDEAVPFQTSVGAATRRNSFTKTEAHEVSGELARVYDKLDLGKEWDNIIAGKKIIETDRDINYKGLTSENWHNAMLAGKMKNTEQETSRIGINCICNPENRLIRGILYELQCALKRKNWSWARFANYLLQIKKDNSMREFDESKEEIDTEQNKNESSPSTEGKEENGNGSRKRKHQDSVEIDNSSVDGRKTPSSSYTSDENSIGKVQEEKNEEKPSSINVKRKETRGETAEEKNKEEEDGPKPKKAKFADDDNQELEDKIRDKNDTQDVKGDFHSPFQKNMKIEVDTEILDQSMDTNLMENVKMPYASSASTPSAYSTVQISSSDEGQERKEGIERAYDDIEVANNIHC